MTTQEPTQIKQTPMNIIYDMDDVLNDLNESVYRTLGLSDKFAQLKRYYVTENVELGILTQEQGKSVLSLYENPETFKRLSARKGIERIMDIESHHKDRVCVSVYSQSLNKEINEIKYDFIKEHIPNMPLDRVHITNTEIKEAKAGASIVVEDSIENLLRYDKSVIKILMSKSYNKYENYQDLKEQIDNSGTFIRVYSLEDAITVIEGLIYGGVLDRA